ncbi:MAG: VOC family protein [Myxococcota bacterium]
MAKITGLGGFFFKTADREATSRWFTEKLGLPMETWGQMFPSEPQKETYTVLGLHGRDSDYFTGSTREFMLNLRVDDLEGMLADLAKKGVQALRVFPPDDNGRFAHIAGPDGITLELWQPAEP